MNDEIRAHLDALEHLVVAAESVRDAKAIQSAVSTIIDRLPEDAAHLMSDPTDLLDWCNDVIAATDLVELAEATAKAEAAVTAREFLGLSDDDVDTIAALVKRATAARTTVLPRTGPKGTGGAGNPKFAHVVTVAAGGDHVYRGQDWKALQKQAKAWADDNGYDWKSILAVLKDIRPDLEADNANTASWAAGPLTITRN